MEKNNTRLTGVLILAFFLSGFSALLYQVVWQRMLGLFSGSDVRSVTIVVSAYLLGLGVGSLIGSLVADRLSNRQAVQVYGLCNLGIAAFAFGSRFLYYDILFEELNTLSRSPVILLGVVFASLLIPTALMGLSLPLLSKALVRSVENAAYLISLLSAVNTFGAGMGTILAGRYLIGMVGYEITVYLGALLSFLVGVLALLVARQFSVETSLTPKAGVRFKDVPSTVWMWCAFVFFSGFIVISLELIWFRMLDIMLRSNAYTFAHLLFVFLAGDAVGSLLGARYVHRIQNPRRAFLWIQGWIALYSVLVIAMLTIAAERITPFSNYLASTTLRTDFARVGDQNEWLIYMLLHGIILFPPAILIGLYFPIVQKAIQTDTGVVGQRVGLVDVANIAGNALGGILTGTLLFHFLGTADSIRLMVGIGAVFMFVAVAESFRRLRGHVQISSGLLMTALLIGLALLPSEKQFWSTFYGVQASEDFFVAENSTGVAAIRTFEGYSFIYANGVVQGTLPVTPTHSVLGAFPALIHPNPVQVLVIGIGSAGTPYSVGINPSTEKITAVEIVGSQLDVLELYDAEKNNPVFDTLLNDDRYEIIVGDGRRELALTDEKFDLIEADAIRPTSSHSGLLYSREFFELAKSKLAEGGIMAQWSPTARIRRTFISVFPYVIELNGWLLLGSKTPIYYDPNALWGRLQTPESVAYLSDAGLDVETLRQFVDYEPGYWTPETPRDTGDMNTDLFPRDEYYLNNPDE